MRRIVVLGGLGLFGRTAVEQLCALGAKAKTAGRGASADIRVDANDAESIRGVLRAGDVVIDTAGPFYARTNALLEAAIDASFDIVDINDDLNYAERVLTFRDRIERAGIRLLSSASTVSAIAAAVVRRSGIPAPVGIASCLAPASRHTANAGAARSLLRSVGRPVRALRRGDLKTLRGWEESRPFAMPPPLENVRGRLFESADALYLPLIWPTLRDVAMYVAPNVPGMDPLLRLASRMPPLRRLLEAQVDFGAAIARRIGSVHGGIGYEIEDPGGNIARYAILAQTNSYVMAVAPAVAAAVAIAHDRFPDRGLVLPDRHAEPAALFEYLGSLGIECVELAPL